MKKTYKRVVSFMLVALILSGCIAFASDERVDPPQYRWSYFSVATAAISETGTDDIYYGCTARTYSGLGVSSVKVEIRLQRITATGAYYTVDTSYGSNSGTASSAGDTYYNAVQNSSYRVKFKAWCYDSSGNLLEETAWMYKYLDT